MRTMFRWIGLATCLATVAVVGVAPAVAQRGSTAKYKKGDRVEAKRGFDWQPGTVVRTDSNSGWIEVRLDDDDAPSGAPKQVREMMRTSPYPPDSVRPLAGEAAGDQPARRWSDRSGKFSVNARFDGVNESRVGLIKADGKRIEVPLEKLSDADQKYVEKLTAAAENPFGESTDESGSIAESRKANWREVKAIRPQKFSKWTFVPRAPASGDLLKLAGAPSAEVTLNEIPDSQKFFEKVNGIYVASDGTRALVCRTEGAVSQNNPQYVEAVDLQNSSVGELVPLPEETAVLDIDPDAGLVMYRPERFGFGEKTTLTIARIKDGKLSIAAEWEPYAHEKWEPQRDIEKAWFLGRGRVLTMNHHAKALTVWNVADAKALINIPVRTSILLEIALSPDRALLGVIMQEGIAIIELGAGQHVATIPTAGKKVSKIAFRGDNSRLAAMSDQGVTIWDLATGKEIAGHYHSVLNSSSGLKWAGEYLLVQNRYLFDTERRILLWEYQDAPGRGSTAAVRDGRIWAVPSSLQESESVLISAALPDRAAIDLASSLPSAEELLVVRPGDPVKLEIEIDPAINVAEELQKALAADKQSGQDGGNHQPKIVYLNASGAQQDIIRDRLVAALQEAGLKVVDDAPLVVKAVCKPQPQQTLRINVDGRWPVQPQDIVEKTITPHASYLEMLLNGEQLWRRGFVATAGGHVIYVNQGETLDQALERMTKPNVGLFMNAKFSGHVARPGKATPNGAYGVSQFTSSGLIEGQSADGRGAVFE